MLDRRYHNARADDCSIPQVGAGPMTVHYQGVDYVVIGVYFAACCGGHEIRYVLRPTLLSDEDIADNASPSSVRTTQPGPSTRTKACALPSSGDGAT